MTSKRQTQDMHDYHAFVGYPDPLLPAGAPPLKPCDNAFCDRLIREGIMYCCSSCEAAATGRYEVHDAGPLSHATSCNDRWDERRTAFDAR